MPPARFFRMPHRHRWFACLLVVLLAVAGSLQAGWDFARIMARAEQLFPAAEAARDGVKLVFLNTAKCGDADKALLDLTDAIGSR